MYIYIYIYICMCVFYYLLSKRTLRAAKGFESSFAERREDSGVEIASCHPVPAQLCRTVEGLTGEGFDFGFNTQP